MTGLLQRLIMTVSLQKKDISQFSQRIVTNSCENNDHFVTFTFLLHLQCDGVKIRF